MQFIFSWFPLEEMVREVNLSKENLVMVDGLRNQNGPEGGLFFEVRWGWKFTHSTPVVG